MNRFFKSLLFITPTLLLTGFQTAKMQDYCNSRFAFCIQYPDSFAGQGESENGDGQLFLSKDGHAEIRAYGQLAIEDVTTNLTDVYTMAAKDLNVSYHVVKTDWFVLSGLDKGGKIVYVKTAKKKIAYMGSNQPDTFAYQTLMITYPKSAQSQYGSYCGVISQSFGK